MLAASHGVVVTVVKLHTQGNRISAVMNERTEPRDMREMEISRS